MLLQRRAKFRLPAVDAHAGQRLRSATATAVATRPAPHQYERHAGTLTSNVAHTHPAPGAVAVSLLGPADGQGAYKPAESEALPEPRIRVAFNGDGLQGPLQAPAQPSRVHAGRQLAAGPALALTPKVLEELGDLFLLDARTMQALVHKQPKLLQLDTAALERQMAAVMTVFATSREQVVLMLQLQPWLLEMPEAELRERLEALTSALCLPPRVVRRLCCASPATLRYEPAAFRGRLQQLATLLDVPLEWVVEKGISNSQLLNFKVDKARKRVEGMASSLGITHEAALELAAKQPRLLMFSTRILQNKVKVIQSILDRPLSVVGHMAVKCPDLIYTTCQDDVRRVVEGLQRVTECNAVFAVKVAEAAPGILLIPWRILEKRTLQLQEYVRYCHRWSRGWEHLTPYLMAKILSETDATHHRLRFLLDGRMADRHGLSALIMMKHADFCRRHPGFLLWMQRHNARQAALPPAPAVPSQRSRRRKR